ncbi:MAG: tRNA lysidine(34) synthetase TilS [Lentisphaerae bacterium]|jgi:tRNA(Ile)-lysidine synthase|nr:tRNA lysidine(34) synthetase TilS [Lentisphaerota bacterium]MBT4816541.1 tRNA lysidine(34) synthetase TilS [Lentisphaerota bacterium]MBT5606181.1 tRNA lysidine(34) synthetase TilS [Lentisphaerota bacterium]MBT7057873.1 tRNA lysidine(34) synthetase TilS [Lentisphaerota bacterium]MBT7841733.1 tRNA lysidine(34) synthetase TilS [Lentisphaerota bacterium]
MSVLPKLADRVRQFIGRHRLFGERLSDASVWVGFSGGADSTALLLVLHELGFSPLAVHLNHGLRGEEADADVEWCHDLCATRGISFESHRLDLGEGGRGPEDAGRARRLAFWENRVGDNDVVALGHHRGDAVEDMLLRLVRGANATGLTGLRPARQIGNVCYVRPLLELTKDELIAYLQGQGVHEWCRDGTNSDCSFRRNAVRHEWLPLIRDRIGHDQGLVQTLWNLRMDADFLEEEARRLTGVVDDPRLLRDLHPALFPRVLREWLRQETGRDTILRRPAITRLREALERCASESVEIPLGEGISLIVSPAGVRVKQCVEPWDAISWNWRDTPVLRIEELGLEFRACEMVASPDVRTLAEGRGDVEWFSLRDFPAEVLVRPWQCGDRMVPFGRKSPKKLQDLFVDGHVPREERQACPILDVGGEVVWVPGLKRSAFGAVTPGSNAPCIRLECFPLAGGRKKMDERMKA